MYKGGSCSILCLAVAPTPTEYTSEQGGFKDVPLFTYCTRAFLPASPQGISNLSERSSAKFRPAQRQPISIIPNKKSKETDVRSSSTNDSSDPSLCRTPSTCLIRPSIRRHPLPTQSRAVARLPSIFAGLAPYLNPTQLKSQKVNQTLVQCMRESHL